MDGAKSLRFNQQPMSEQEPGRVRISMTMTEDSEAWLHETYDEALETQEAIRMAISDARRARDLEMNLQVQENSHRDD